MGLLEHKGEDWASWFEPDSAESIKVAKFPDGYYWVLVDASDKDSTKHRLK